MSVIQTSTDITDGLVQGQKNIVSYYGESPNTRPSVTPIEISFDWNTVYQFTQNTILNNYSDVESDGAHTILIKSLPIRGKLTFNGSLTREGQIISVTNLSGLSFIPQANQYGKKYDTFEILIRDVGIAPNNWSDAIQVTFTIDRTIQLPTASNKTVTIANSGAYRFRVNDLIAGYQGGLILYFQFTSIPPQEVGLLQLDQIILTESDLPLTLTPKQLGDKELIFTDNGKVLQQKDVLFDYTIHDKI